MKAYTGTGDRGTTSLLGGKRIGKANARIAAIGTVDELNAVIGVALAFILDKDEGAVLSRVQEELFSLGAELASILPVGAKTRISGAHVKALENDIKDYGEAVEGLTGFVLPSGSKSAALLHLARTVARRAEREVVVLSEAEEVNPETIRYLNRLSSLLFAMALNENKGSGVRERSPKF